MPDLNYLEEKDEDIDSLEELAVLVEKLVAKRKNIEFLEEQLTVAKKFERLLSQEEIPSLLLKNNLTSITLESGEQITIIENLRVSLPKNSLNRSVVLKWLIENGGENMIKKELVIDEPEEHIKQYLKKCGVPFIASQDIHAQTLKAFFKSKLGIAKGSLQEIEISDVPKEANLFVFKETKIK